MALTSCRIVTSPVSTVQAFSRRVPTIAQRVSQIAAAGFLSPSMLHYFASEPRRLLYERRCDGIWQRAAFHRLHHLRLARRLDGLGTLQ